MPKHDANHSQHSAHSLQPIMEVALKMHSLFTSSYARYVALEQEVASLASAQFSVYQVELLGAMGAAAQFPWLHLRQVNETPIAELTRAWFELAAQAQAAISRMLRESVPDRGRYLPLVPGRDAAVIFDRRKTAVIINFPDRRVASR